MRFADVLTGSFDDVGAGAAGIGEIVRATVAFGFVCAVRVAAGFGFGSGLAVRVAVGFGSGLAVRVAVGFGVGLTVRVTVGFGVGLTVWVAVGFGVGLGHAGVLPLAPLEPPDGSPVAVTLQADPQATFAKANLTVRV